MFIYYHSFVSYSTHAYLTRYDKPEYRLHDVFKSEFVQEPYIPFNVPKFQRSLFALFRAGILPLQTDRFVNKPLNERICYLCPNEDVEDEVHFLTNCSLYDTYRVVMDEQACRINPEFPFHDNLVKFIFLLNDMKLETFKKTYIKLVSYVEIPCIKSKIK